MKKLSIALMLAVVPLGGCGSQPDGALDETLAEESVPLTDGPFTLRNFQTGLCMGVKGGTPTGGTPMIVWTCDGSANQRWTKGPTSLSNPAYQLLKNGVAADRCLWSGHFNGSQAYISSCDPRFGVYNGWRPIFAGTDRLGHECYRFQNEGSQNPVQVLGVLGGSTSLGAKVVIWDDFNDPWGHPDQIWCTY
jgi:hypothetical protein